MEVLLPTLLALALMAAAVLTMNFVADILYGVLDPRVSYDE